MAQIGQIIYNLEDYNSNGGYISTANANVSTTVSSLDPEYQNKKINLFTRNLVQAYDTTAFTKIGVQAPAGTRFIINDGVYVLIGRTGMFELDDDINITNLTFIRPKKFILDEEETQLKLEEGQTQMLAAEQKRANSLAELDSEYADKDKDVIYWERYDDIHQIFVSEYNIAYGLFSEGINGVYSLPNPEVPDAEENFQDLYNIIIDFIY